MSSGGKQSGNHVGWIGQALKERSGSRRLVLAWAVVTGTAVAGGGVLAALGAPAQSVASPAAPHSTVARSALPTDQGDAIPNLLARVETEIAEAPDGAPPGDDATRTLERVAEVLPSAPAVDREHADELASALFDRARAALGSGKVDEEQQWLALGSILAPPPEIGPDDLAEAGQQPDPGSSRQDITPNAAEAEDQAMPERAATTWPVRQQLAASEARNDRPHDRSPSSAAKPAQPPSAGLTAPPNSPALPEPSRNPASGEVARGNPAAAPIAPASDAGLARQWSAGDSATIPFRSQFAAAGQSGDPAISGRRVVVHYADGNRPAAAEASRIAGSLLARAGSVEIRAVGAAPRRASVRYFYPQDEQAAQRLGELLDAEGGQWSPRSFTSYEPKPRPGTIEVWIAG